MPDRQCGSIVFIVIGILSLLGVLIGLVKATNGIAIKFLGKIYDPDVLCVTLIIVGIWAICIVVLGLCLYYQKTWAGIALWWLSITAFVYILLYSVIIEAHVHEVIMTAAMSLMAWQCRKAVPKSA